MARVINKTSARKPAAKPKPKPKATKKRVSKAATTKASAQPKKTTKSVKASKKSTKPSAKKAAKASPKAKSRATKPPPPAKSREGSKRSAGAAAAPRSEAAQSTPDKPKKAPARRGKSAPAVAKPLPEVSGDKQGNDRESLKARFAALRTATSEISGMKRSISKNFFDVGVILNRIRSERLYEVKGYGSFESFVEREIELSKVVCLRSARIAESLRRDVALQAGLERSSAAVAALDGEPLETDNSGRPTAAVAMSTLPLHKQ